MRTQKRHQIIIFPVPLQKEFLNLPMHVPQRRRLFGQQQSTKDNRQRIFHYFSNTGEIEQQSLPFLEKEQIELVGRLDANCKFNGTTQRKKCFGNHETHGQDA